GRAGGLYPYALATSPTLSPGHGQPTADFSPAAGRRLLIHDRLFGIGRKGRIGLGSAQEIERVVELDVVLGFRRYIGDRARTFIAFLDALYVALEVGFAPRHVAALQLIR